MQSIELVFLEALSRRVSVYPARGCDIPSAAGGARTLVSRVHFPCPPARLSRLWNFLLTTAHLIYPLYIRPAKLLFSRFHFRPLIQAG